MEKQQVDRRYQRTHEIIISTVISIALTRGWEKVNVTEVAKVANINRNSFYIHFETINDVFDEIEDRFIKKYQESLIKAVSIDEMIKDTSYYDMFIKFLNSEAKYVDSIKKMGRANFLLTKIRKEYMKFFEKELSSSIKYKKAKDLILPYIAGSTSIFFDNWVNNPLAFDIKKHAVFSGEFIERILLMV